MKIKFQSDDDLPLGKAFNILDMIIVVASPLEKMVKIIHNFFYINARISYKNAANPTHVTCMALHHTVAICCSTSITYWTPCHASRHLVIYPKCYGYERAFLLSGVFTLHSFLLFLRIPWSRQFNLKASRVSC